MGGTEPENHINNPTQTENSSMGIPHVSRQDHNEDADPTTNGTLFRIFIEFRTIQSNPIDHIMT
jgi:hypothetical protein